MPLSPPPVRAGPGTIHRGAGRVRDFGPQTRAGLSLDEAPRRLAPVPAGGCHRMTDFHTAEPGRAACWRAVVLFGQNSASYKFALARALLELAPAQPGLVRLEELALPFARRIWPHLRSPTARRPPPRAGSWTPAAGSTAARRTRTRCAPRPSGSASRTSLDAFHVVNGTDVPVRFFADEREAGGGIRPTDELFRMLEEVGGDDLGREAEARWRLVETAWGLELPARRSRSSTTPPTARWWYGANVASSSPPAATRSTATSAGAASTAAGRSRSRRATPRWPTSTTCSLGRWCVRDRCRGRADGVWNLVLACRDCNRGRGASAALAPGSDAVARLHRRNKYLIQSTTLCARP